MFRGLRSPVASFLIPQELIITLDLEIQKNSPQKQGVRVTLVGPEDNHGALKYNGIFPASPHSYLEYLLSLL
jgi:hypothetical protein